MSDPFIGQICIFGFIFPPYGWALCDGSLLTIQQQQALFALIGNRFGGDGRTTFSLPDLRGRLPRGQGQGVGLTNVAVGTTGGSERTSALGCGSTAFTLQPAQVPGHIHPATFSATTGSQPVTIPASAASGGITVSPAPTMDIVSGSNGIDPVAGGNYWLTGVSGSGGGPVTATAPTAATKATVNGLNVAVDASTFTPAIPEKTVNITSVTGGTVAVGSQNTAATQPVSAPVSVSNLPVLSPYLGLNFCIAITGLWPEHD